MVAREGVRWVRQIESNFRASIFASAFPLQEAALGLGLPVFVIKNDSGTEYPTSRAAERRNEYQADLTFVHGGSSEKPYQDPDHHVTVL